MAQDERDRLLGAEIGEPIPDEHALDGDDDILPVGLDGPEKSLRRGLTVFVEHGVALLIQDAKVHRSGVQIDSAIKFVLVGVESHMASSFGVKCFSPKKAFYHASGGGLNEYQINTADRYAPADFFVMTK